MGHGIPGAFVAVFILIALLGIGTGISRVAMARRMAREAGLAPTTATAMALLSKDGLGTAYLASSLRPQTRQQPASIPDPRSTEQRLAELASQRANNVITQGEHDAQRREILGKI